jgi:hypothetical protein
MAALDSGTVASSRGITTIWATIHQATPCCSGAAAATGVCSGGAASWKTWSKSRKRPVPSAATASAESDASVYTAESVPRPGVGSKVSHP